MNNGRKKKARELLQPFLIRRLCLNFLSSEFTVVPLSVFFRIKEDFLRSDKMEERGGGVQKEPQNARRGHSVQVGMGMIAR